MRHKGMSTPSPSGPFIPPPTPSLIPFGPLAASTAAPEQYRVLSNRMIGLAACLLINVTVKRGPAARVWATLSGSLLALGDGDGLNFATPNADLAERLNALFRLAVR